MEHIGTTQRADGSINYITAHGDSYDTTKAAIEAAVPEGTKLIAIRKDN
ncbi:hypothetical protein [Arthrobacter sp. HS15c]